MVPPILQAYQTLGRGDLKLPKGDDGDGDVLGGVIALGSPSRFGAPITTNHKVWLMLPEWECLAVVEIILTMPVLLCWSKRAG